MKSFQAKNREDWSKWLKNNHLSETEIWLVYYKKHTGKQTISYLDSVEEAICFGWIDGLKKSIDDEKYTHKFTIRKAKSRWSPQNIILAEKMIAENKMTRAGLEFFEQRIEYDKEFLKVRDSINITLPPEIEQALKKNRKAWENYTKLTPGYKKQYAGWLISAKREETQKKRLEEAIKLLEQNKKLGMK